MILLLAVLEFSLLVSSVYNASRPKTVAPVFNVLVLNVTTVCNMLDKLINNYYVWMIRDVL